MKSDGIALGITDFLDLSAYPSNSLFFIFFSFCAVLVGAYNRGIDHRVLVLASFASA
ncbi:hypothetical protein [Holospora undulata]|uniref:hypothetical protein n=1 Tax=Holospora undulata TaxID=1169117 RepID=UPI001F2A9BEF|nr:hypothetical protein [Holospora undulata]